MSKVLIHDEWEEKYGNRYTYIQDCPGMATLFFLISNRAEYNAAGQPLTSVQKQLISQLSPTLENKSLFINERGLTSAQWSEYSGGTKRTQYSSDPTSSITAETLTAFGVTLSQKDHAGIVFSATRSTLRTSATVNGGSNACDYDNIGNRKTAQEAA